MKIIGGIILLAIFLIALALGAQNQESVNFNYLIAQGEFSLAMLIGGGFGIGFLLGWLVCGTLYFKAKLAKSRLRKKVAKQQTEIDRLRTAPAIERNTDTENQKS